MSRDETLMLVVGGVLVALLLFRRGVSVQASVSSPVIGSFAPGVVSGTLRPLGSAVPVANKARLKVLPTSHGPSAPTIYGLRGGGVGTTMPLTNRLGMAL